ncbi:type II toxin-antitoxin system VapC family toxin [bacterium]|nr:type II toxin-antitoxin system VapC family toxin [bacterium]
MNYWDTSLLVKLYAKERDSLIVEKKVKEINEAILLINLHDLEFFNALNLKKWRNEISDEDLALIRTRFKEHENRGVYYRPAIDWSQVYQIAISLSNSHTGNTGTRSLDVLHVAAAISLNSTIFFTNDKRQQKLAELSGLQTVILR